MHVIPLGESLSAWSALPFLGLLLSIGLFPLLAPRFWHRHYPKVAAAWALLFAVPFLAVFRSAALLAILHVILADYLPFVILLGALFTVAGGILLRGAPEGTPRTNTLILAAGTAIASWIGTTGASMLLIRPLLRANARRRTRKHTVVFFIFLVSNTGGALTPLGDPPLFLGFLLGVPFFWTLRLAPHMGLTAAVLLGIFYVLDRRLYRREGRLAAEPGEIEAEPMRISGAHNFIFLAAILVAVLLSGSVRLGDWSGFGVRIPRQGLLRDLVLLVLGFLSLRTTSRPVRAANGFGWGPMREVAVLFAGIFVTLVPAIEMLRAGERGALGPIVHGANTAWQYFWLTGGLSSFLDNAPTYVTFLNTGLGKFYPGVPAQEAVLRLIQEHPDVLQAVSAGAVFMGACTYIGNAPNLMVRSIAEEAGVRMPGFFAYIALWTLPILIPSLVLVTLVFFR